MARARQNRFSAIAAALKGEDLPEQIKIEQTQPTAEPEPNQESKPLPEPPAEKPRSSRATGKRSDPNFTQVGAYIPKTLHRQVKRLLIDEDGDLSDLVTQLLQEWVDRKGRPTS